MRKKISKKVFLGGLEPLEVINVEFLDPFYKNDYLFP